jgi:hypothetical protein
MLVVFLLDINQVKDVTQLVYSTGRVEVTVDVFDMFKTLFVKLGLPDEQVGHGRFAAVCDDFLSPDASCDILVSCDEAPRRTSPVGSPAEAGLDNLLCIEPGFFVLDWLDPKDRWLVLDGRKGWIGLTGTSDLAGTSNLAGTSAGLVMADDLDEPDKSDEVGKREPATKEMTKQTPVECPPNPGVP